MSFPGMFSAAYHTRVVSFVVCIFFLLGTPGAVRIRNTSAAGEEMKITINGRAGEFVGVKSKWNGHALIFGNIWRSRLTSAEWACGKGICFQFVTRR